MAEPIEWMNLVLALLGSLAAFGSLNKMEHGKTRPCIIGATLLIAVGLAGQWLSLAHEQWLQYVDTALYGGVLALLIASQRTPTWFLDRWANPVASLISLAVGVLFVLGLLTGCTSAPVRLPDCGPFPVRMALSDDGVIFVLSLEEAQRLRDLVRSVQDDKCRVYALDTKS